MILTLENAEDFISFDSFAEHYFLYFEFYFKARKATYD